MSVKYQKKNPKLFYANEKLTEVNNKLKKKTTLGTFINKGTNLWAQTVRKVQWREFDIISPLEIHLNHQQSKEVTSIEEQEEEKGELTTPDVMIIAESHGRF